ncbi:hypothetical protein KSK55_01660 [Methanospirillum purgamenti]|uniref:Uncharacterized protein n=1 Tax=Methanospirillum hungatei TaxID=2203 RepID=A0A8F5VLB5_METHU|nr:hypothetical protein [Methanospirillum hungatei]QXO95147.1 hypothetical protein KSK55_01660 [Methanospirillum hungatei]
MNENKLQELVKLENKSSSFLDEKIPLELLQTPIEPVLFIEKIGELKYKSIWKPIAEKIIYSYSREEIYNLLNLINNNSDLSILIAKRLFDLEDYEGARDTALNAIHYCEWGGYGFPIDDGLKIEAILLIAKIDKEIAKKITFETLFNDLSINFPYFTSITFQLHEFIPDIIEDENEIKQIWIEIFEYLKQLLKEYNLPNHIPEHFTKNIEDDNELSAFYKFIECFY